MDSLIPSVSPKEQNGDIVPRELKKGAAPITHAIPVFPKGTQSFNTKTFEHQSYPDFIIPITNAPFGGFIGMAGLQKVIDIYRRWKQWNIGYKQFKNLKSIQASYTPTHNLPSFTTPADFLNEIRKNYWGSFSVASFKDEVNNFTTSQLPLEIREYFTALNCELGDMNFYNAFALLYVGDTAFATSFRNAVAFDVITNPEKFQDTCNLLNEGSCDVVRNLQASGAPTTTEILVLSQLTDRNITVFEFDENMQLKSDVYFDAHPNRDTGIDTIYLGKLTSEEGTSYFPLVRNSTNCEFLPKANTSILTTAINARKTQQFSNIDPKIPPTANLLPQLGMDASAPYKDETTFPESAATTETQKPHCFSNQEQGTSVEVMTNGASGQILCCPELDSPKPIYEMTNNGIPNIGNSCYASAAIQSLLAFPEVRQMAQSGALKLLEEAIFTDDLHHDLQQWLAVNGVRDLLVELNDVRDEFGNMHEQFHPLIQNDSLQLIQQLFQVDNYANIKELFSFHTSGNLVCVQCNTSRELQENLEMQIIIPPSSCIQEAVDAFFSSPETIECNCTGCGSPVMDKSSKLIDSPENLLLVTQAFDNAGNKQPALQNAQQHADYIVLTTNTGKDLYELKSMVVHAGTSNMSGHFIANIKNNDVWVRADDDKISVGKEPEINHGETVYIQMYSKLSNL